MEFAELRSFLVVAEEGSFSRAAERLLRTQPAISLAVQRLEAHVGEPLFTRTHRKPELTMAGRLLVDYAHRLLALRDEARLSLSELSIQDRSEAGQTISQPPVVAPCDSGELSTMLDTVVREALTSRVYDVARETPLEPAPRLSRRLQNRILLKREDLQVGFSFKIRGAYNRIARLTPEDRRRGVVAASAGNHAQGVALSARTLGLRALIVMPRTTPEIKVDAVRALGADVVLCGRTYSDAQAHAERLAEERKAIVIHPFDDPLVIAGQATVADEIVRQRPEPIDAVFVPVGGGGLIAGIGAYIKRVMPDVAVIGVEPRGADAMARSLEAGRRVALDDVGTFADGVAVREVGHHTFAIAQATVDRIVRVTDDEICAAIKDVFDETRTVLEPAGALSIAGLKAHVAATGIKGRRLVAVLSGANIDFERVRFVAERTACVGTDGT